jgi:hypothetical protein
METSLKGNVVIVYCVLPSLPRRGRKYKGIVSFQFYWLADIVGQWCNHLKIISFPPQNGEGI